MWYLEILRDVCVARKFLLAKIVANVLHWIWNLFLPLMLVWRIINAITLFISDFVENSYVSKIGSNEASTYLQMTFVLFSTNLFVRFFWEVFYVKLVNSKALHICLYIKLIYLKSVKIAPSWIKKVMLSTFSLFLFLEPFHYIFFFFMKVNNQLYSKLVCIRILLCPKLRANWFRWTLFTNSDSFTFWYLKKNSRIQITAVNGPEKIKENIITKLFEVQKFDYFRFL